MENKKRPSFQFYPTDWLSDRNTQLMTAEEEGAYIRLICYMWDTDDCVLPYDIAYLGRLARVGSTVVQAILHCFEIQGDFITHKRLQKERQKQNEWKEKSRLAGIKSGLIRSKKRRLVKNGLNQTRTKSNSPTPTPSPSPSLIISKEITPQEEYGRPEINRMLKALKGKLGIEAFADASIERNIGLHCVNLMVKIGVKEFTRRLDIISSDGFKRKNCNRIKYVYNEIKGFIEPQNNRVIKI